MLLASGKGSGANVAGDAASGEPGARCVVDTSPTSATRRLPRRPPEPKMLPSRPAAGEREDQKRSSPEARGALKKEEEKRLVGDALSGARTPAGASFAERLSDVSASLPRAAGGDADSSVRCAAPAPRSPPRSLLR